jgi:hypothetical protein
MLDVVAGFGGGVTGEVVVVVAVVDPLAFEVSLVVPEVGGDAVELALVLPVAAAAAALAPSAPQPASAIARAPSKDAITTRAVPRSPVTGQACLIPTPEK